MPSLPVAAGAIGAVKMTCLPGERAVTGGLQSDADPLNIFAVTESFPVTTGDVPTGLVPGGEEHRVVVGPVPRVPHLREAMSGAVRRLTV